VLEREGVQEVIIADSDFPQDRAVELVDRCHQRGVNVHVAPTTMEILMDRAEFVPGMSVPLFTLRPPVFEGIDFALKRSFDLVISTLVLIFLSPLLLLIALAVKVSSPGPVIYRSMRPGFPTASAFAAIPWSSPGLPRPNSSTTATIARARCGHATHWNGYCPAW